MFENVLKRSFLYILVYDILRVGTMEYPRMNIHVLVEPYIPCIMIPDLKSGLKAADLVSCVNRVFARTPSLRAWHRIELLASALGTTMLQLSLSQDAHMSLMMTACSSWLRTIRQRQDVRLPNFWGYHN